MQLPHSPFLCMSLGKLLISLPEVFSDSGQTVSTCNEKQPYRRSGDQTKYADSGHVQHIRMLAHHLSKCIVCKVKSPACIISSTRQNLVPAVKINDLHLFRINDGCLEPLEGSDRNMHSICVKLLLCILFVISFTLKLYSYPVRDGLDSLYP